MLTQYAALLRTEGVELRFSDEAIRGNRAHRREVNQNVENIGARRLHTILTTLLEGILFDVPDVIDSREVLIDADKVRDALADIVTNRDLSKYIL